MARSYGNYVENSFINGLVTEASGLNFPENAVTAEENCIFKEDGSIERRKGIDYEDDTVADTITRDSSAMVEYLWTAAGGSGDVEFVVQQIGNDLLFYRVSSSLGLSAEIEATTFSLTSFDVAGAPATASEPCSFTSGKGYLFVTHKYCEPFFISYDRGTDTLSATQIDITIRDFEGVDDALDPDEHPVTLSDEHAYNLFNQGWYYEARLGGGSLGFPIDEYFTDLGYYPSNAEQWWLYKNTDEEFASNQAEKNYPGNSLAPKGHYIYSAWLTTRSGTYPNGLAITVDETSSGYYRPNCCAFFAGRVFFAGVASEQYIGNIYFSQIIENDKQIGKCYQASDPTSEHLSDLLPSDGGVIKILDVGEVYKLFATQKALLVFASNGVWSITGSDVAAFSAEDYTIRRITSVGVKNPNAVVDVLGAPVFWNDEGIWTIAYSQGDFVIQSISEGKIKTFLEAVPKDSVRWTKGVYDNVSGIVHWLYRSTAPSTVDNRYNFDRILCFNVKTAGFYHYEIDTTVDKINGIISCAGPENDGSSNSKASMFKYYSSKQTSGTTYSSRWAVEYDTDYVDWATSTVKAYTSEVFTGYKVAAEGNKEFQSNYITFFLKTVTNSSAFAQGCWDYSNSSASIKWTAAQQIYNSTPSNRDYRIRKLKIRGWGKALQLRIYSEAGKPFSITGWSAFVSGNQIP